MFYIVNRYIDDTGKPHTIRLKQEYETLREAQDFLDDKATRAWTSEHDIIEMTPTKIAIDWFRQGFTDTYEIKEERWDGASTPRSTPM